jgi:uncharacterized membrane protein YqjE
MHRGELAGLELREARAHVAGTLAAAGIAATLGLLGGIAGTFAIAAAVWDSPNRGLILGLLTLAYFAAAGALAWWAVRRLKVWRPFAETIYQLREDCSCLHQHLSENSQ